MKPELHPASGFAARELPKRPAAEQMCHRLAEFACASVCSDGSEAAKKIFAWNAIPRGNPDFMLKCYPDRTMEKAVHWEEVG